MWATVVKRFNFIMATAVKRQCGTMLTALGASVSTVLALVQLQKAKTLAVLADLTELLQGRMQAMQWRRVLGKLQHFHFIVRMDNTYFDGMRRPTAAGQELSRGLATIVRCTPLIFYNAKRWMTSLTSVAGASVAAVLPEPPEYAAVPTCFVMSSDAALRVTPPEVPGMGGYLAGYTWQLTLSHASTLGDTSGLHIGALELLAFAGNVIMFHGLLALGLGLQHRVICRVDALTVAFQLRRRAKSPLMEHILSHLKRLPQWADLAPHLTVVHVFGAGNNLADWVSRSLHEKLAHKLQLLRIKHQPLKLRDDFLALVASAMAFSTSEM